MGKRNNIRRTARAAEASADLARRAEIGRRLQLTPAQCAAEDAVAAAMEAKEVRTKLACFAVAAGLAAGTMLGVWLASGLAFLVCLVGGLAIAYVVSTRMPGADKPHLGERADDDTVEIPRVVGRHRG